MEGKEVRDEKTAYAAALWLEPRAPIARRSASTTGSASSHAQRRMLVARRPRTTEVPKAFHTLTAPHMP
jgi:hypothetical protein